ncbi:MAG: carboxylesterase/lipase family protein [Alphaproteobacteria bacterium]|nr:carboxylesterase/lipase family protein [Alphaproteobacteria bacterium]
MVAGSRAELLTRRSLMAGAAALGGTMALAQQLPTREGAVRAYRGIRYGRAARFMPPEPVAFTPQVDAGFGPVCPQLGPYQPQSEDCLFLNIWTAQPAHARKPVMVYIHGGAYANGSVTDPLNHGAALATHGDVVVVTLNHRLNALGYLYLAPLDARFADSGNAGQLDLICALHWVRRHIAAFGGDPHNITLFGQSGGGAKIATLMGMPAARGLFHKAITMSGQQVTVSGPQHAFERTQAYLAALGVRDVDALLALPLAKLVEGLKTRDPVMGGALYFGPVLDMRNLTRHPFWPDTNPQSNMLPMMLGNTICEARAFIPETSARVRGLNWDNLAARMAPELNIDILPSWVVAQFREHYPTHSPQQIFYAAITAARSWRGQVIEAEARAAAHTPTWVYQLDFENAKHTDDIGLSFGTMPNPSAAQRVMSRTMMQAFTRFAQSGDPGWPRYTLRERATMIFDTHSHVAHDPRHWERELFARVPYIQPGS